MKTYPSIAIGIPEILLPKDGTDLTRWAVIACDQFTSEPEYWEKVTALVGDAPSTLKMIYPEVYLGEKDPETRIARIRETMNRYLEQGLFQEEEGFVYVERRTGEGVRKGLMVCLDLEAYDFHRGSKSLIRATEGTILERIPPRVKIRQGAPLEVPHVMVLIDDPENTVIGPLTENKEKLVRLYDFELMLDSGRLAGYRVQDPGLGKGILQALESLAEPRRFVQKYGLEPGTPVLLYAMGDGNHSLATAKTIWEKTKEEAQDKEAILVSPLRYALVELVNLHDEALVFEPIHRVLFDLDPAIDLGEEIKAFFSGRCRLIPAAEEKEMRAAVRNQKGSPHRVGLITPSGLSVIEISRPDSNLPVGSLQGFLDAFLERSGAGRIDYVHGEETPFQLGKRPGCAGFFLPAMDKYNLFKTVILDGALPRKTFSLGEAWEKRFYMEARRLC